ncbi:hypothetical protein FACS1894174_02540 [Bacteroidia bacterium]|nr:hypothetical protein FACS1894155_12360 [Bacteroidia bacterium]GHV20524.1 hypothetical protein FACS1894174_02540 [Bacteroidia bacterium]
MDSKITKRLCFIINTLLFSTSGAIAQDGDFYKSLLKETMKETMKETLKPQTTNTNTKGNKSEKKIIKLEIDPKKITIPIHSSYNYSLDSLKKEVMFRMEEEDILEEMNKLTISSYFFMPYTPPIDAHYNKTPVFIDGKWIPASALPGGGISPVTIINFLFSSGVIKYDPLPPTKSKKEKALEHLREVYGTGIEDNNWNEKAQKLNEYINRLREEVEKNEK